MNTPPYNLDLQLFSTGSSDEFPEPSYPREDAGDYLENSFDWLTDADFDHDQYLAWNGFCNDSICDDATSAFPRTEVTSSQAIHSTPESSNNNIFDKPSLNGFDPTRSIPVAISSTLRLHNHHPPDSTGQIEPFPWNEYVNDSMCADAASANAGTERTLSHVIHTMLKSSESNTIGDQSSCMAVPNGYKPIGSGPGDVNQISQSNCDQLSESGFTCNRSASSVHPTMDMLSESLAWPSAATAAGYDIGGNQHGLNLDTSTEGLRVPLFRSDMQDGQGQIDSRQAPGLLGRSDLGCAEQVQHQNERLPAIQTSPDGFKGHQASQKVTGRSRFTKAQRNILNLWFYEHIENPYPSAESVAILMSRTMLRRRQILDWFSRARQRKLDHVSARIEDQNTQLDAQQLTTLSLEALPTSTRASWSSSGSDGALSNADGSRYQPPPTCNEHQPLNIDNKLDWWLGCLPDEASKYDLNICAPPMMSAPLTLRNPLDNGRIFSWNSSAEVVAVHTNKVSSLVNQGNAWHKDEHDEHNHIIDSRSDYGNISEHGVSAFSGNSTHSEQSRSSNISSYSAYSSTSLGPRKGRRRVVGTSQNAAIRRENRISKTRARFVYNFCDKWFYRKYVLVRHINSIHEPKTVWVCQQRLHLAGDGDTEMSCEVCHQNPVHCMHNMMGCMDKRKEDRTYYRRDGFVQHLMGVHNLERADIAKINLQNWEEKIAIDNDTWERKAVSDPV